MKKWIFFVIAVLLFGTGIAQDTDLDQFAPYNYDEYKMGKEVYNALLELPALLKYRLEQRERGFELTEGEQATLDGYLEQTKGVMVVVFGSEGCGPCENLMRLLEDQNAPGNNNQEDCTINLWRKQGVRFYQIDAEIDKNQNYGHNLSRAWRVRSTPATFVIKDGLRKAIFGGYNDNKAEETLAVLKREVNRLR